jgi:hypothetical protein
MTSPSRDLYEQDFYVWARRQAAALRRLAATRPNIDVDWPHLIDEVEALARAEQRTCRSLLRHIIEHLLKLDISPAVGPRAGWRHEVRVARADLADALTRTLKADLRRNLPSLYANAVKSAADALAQYGEDDAATRLPEQCPYTLDQLLDEEYYPKR